MDLTTTAYGTWNGGRYIHYGQKLDEEAFVKAARYAYDRGIRTFITADAYGSGEADVLLGQALKDLPRDSYCLVGAVGHDFYRGKREGSKGFPRFTDPRFGGPEGYAGYLRTATERSLERIGTDHFDLLMLHNPDKTGYTSTAVWEGMAGLKTGGFTKMLGIAPGPANGFTLDILGCFEQFGPFIDWAMLILNPLEPWPGKMVLPAAKIHGIKVVTRVVDYGGIFHGDVKSGHKFSPTDHRGYRPAGWVEAGNEKLDQIMPYAERHEMTPLQLACDWNLSQTAVECVVPTLIAEEGEWATPIETKVADLAGVTEKRVLSENELAEIEAVGDNKGCMSLKGGTRQYQGAIQADQWPMDDALEAVAARWNIEPERDLYNKDDPRDKRDKGMPINGVPQPTDRRLYVQLHVYTGASDAQTKTAIEAVANSGFDSVVYANVNDPRGIGVLLMAEDPGKLADDGRNLLSSGVFSSFTPVPEFTMIGRTYGFGREVDVNHWLLKRPVDHATNPDWPWAIWYPLRRKGEFNKLGAKERMEILKEHGTIGFQYGGAGYAGDVRLASFGLDKDDNEYTLGIMGPRLDWLSKLVEDMRPTTQTSLYMDKLGPFFVGKTLYQSGQPVAKS